MKKILSAVLLLSVVFVFACKKKDKGYVFPHTGNWAGTYTGTDNGKWQAAITNDGNFSGTATSNFLPDYPFNITGTVSNTGKISAQYNYLNITASFEGQITGTDASGTWSADTLNAGGTWTGSRQQ